MGTRRLQQSIILHSRTSIWLQRFHGENYFIECLFDIIIRFIKKFGIIKDYFISPLPVLDRARRRVRLVINIIKQIVHKIIFDNLINKHTRCIIDILGLHGSLYIKKLISNIFFLFFPCLFLFFLLKLYQANPEHF